MTRLTRSPGVALLGEAPPRVLVEPQGVRANSWEDVADLSASLGVTLDDWQELILRAAMGERRDRTWAAKRVGVTVPRQNGKSQLLVSRALAGALLFGERKIVISAHQQDTAREAFAKLMEIIEDDANASLRARVKSVMNAMNREHVKFNNGATIQFKARSGAAGKGFSSDCLMLDEAQILGARAWTSINSTMSAMPNPQVWLLGTAPQAEDDSEVFESVRAAAVTGKSTAAAWCEWGVDRDSPEYAAAAASLSARQWSPEVEYLCWSGNPAWNTRLNHEVVQGECETYSPERFGQDRLGLWSSENIARVIDANSWASLKTTTPPTEGRVTYGIKFSPDGTTVALAACMRPESGPLHVELIEHRSMSAGLGWLTAWLVERHEQAAQIVIDGKAHSGALFLALRAEKVPERVILMPTIDEVITAHSMMLGAITSKEITHFDQLALNESVALAGKRLIGKNGGWGWEPLADGDVTPIEAATYAHWGAKTSKRRPGRKTRGRVMA